MIDLGINDDRQVLLEQIAALLSEGDALLQQLRQIRKQQAALAEKAARLRLQIALRDKSRFDSEDTDWR